MSDRKQLEVVPIMHTIARRLAFSRPEGSATIRSIADLLSCIDLDRLNALQGDIPSEFRTYFDSLVDDLRPIAKARTIADMLERAAELQARWQKVFSTTAGKSMVMEFARLADGEFE